MAEQQKQQRQLGSGCRGRNSDQLAGNVDKLQVKSGLGIGRRLGLLSTHSVCHTAKEKQLARCAKVFLKQEIISEARSVGKCHWRLHRLLNFKIFPNINWLDSQLNLIKLIESKASGIEANSNSHERLV